MKIENSLKKYRLLKNLKQHEVARCLNITLRHYKSLEAGTSDGSIKLWKQLAKLYGTTIDDLLEQEVENNLLVK